MMFGLDYLLSPCSVEEFRRAYYRERALHIPGADDKFTGLFAWDDINDVMSNHRSSWDGVRLVYETKNLPHEALQNLDQWLSQGATLVINAVNQIDPIVGRFAALLGHELNTHVNINSYTSCPSKQGFDNHYDKHDVFIVQLAGKKSWTVFEPTREWPLERETGPKGNPPDTKPYLACDLTAGDVLYIPRGHWHYAVAVTPSIHFTVGPQSRTGIDLLLWLTQKLMENDEFFRKDFPILRAPEFGGGEPNPDFADHMAEFRSRMTEILDRDSLTEAFIRFCMASNPVRRTYQLPSIWTLKDEITPETSFILPDEQKTIIRYDPDARSAVVLSRGRELHLNDLSTELLAGIFNSDRPISGSTLMAMSPGTTWKQLKGPLLSLFDHGILRLHTEGADGHAER